ncbi:unnamed protein product, partial [Rotaria sp. Silwood2]
MLSVTYDVFIHTLDECVKLSTDDSSQSLLLLSPISSTTTVRTSPLRTSFSEIDSTKSANSATPTVLPKQIVYKTFFSQLPYACLAFKDIHSELFLSTCEQYLALIDMDFILNIKNITLIVIDKFNSTTFITLRADFNGNISKLRRKISNDLNKFQTLYSIVNDEITSKTTKEKNSAIDALLWLR